MSGALESGEAHMKDREAVLAELEGTRERAARLLRAKLDAVAAQVREAAARAAGDLEVVVPPDLELLVPLAPVAKALEAMSAPAAPPRVSLEALRQLDAGRAQSEVLKGFLGQLAPFCGARAILVFRDSEVSGWSGDGFTDSGVVRGWRGSLGDSQALARAVSGVPVLVNSSRDRLLGTWFAGQGDVLLVVPMSLRGKVVGAVVAASGDLGLVAEEVQQLTYLAGLLLETLAVRPVVPTPALLEPESLGAAAAETARETAAVPFEMPPAPALEVAPGIGGEEVVPDGAATVELKVPVAPAPVVLRSAEEERKHEEARRFARLLVSEIRLYNEQAVQEGRAAHDLYRRLKEDIDRSREMYEQRVASDVRASSNYFSEELVRILADGDANALGV